MDALLTKTREKTVLAEKEKISGSEALLRCLVAENVKTNFWLSGWSHYASV